MAWTLTIQIALPLVLLGWLSVFPARSAAGLVLQALACASMLLALAVVAMWGILLWWLPWLYGAVFAIIVIWRLSQHRHAARASWPTGARAWIGVAVSLALMATGAWYTALGWSARTPPDLRVIDLSNPFGAGHYVVAQGGSQLLVNGHLRTLDTGVERYADWRGQSYGIDFLGIGRWGLRADGLQPASPTAYVIFEAPLHAPCSGKVLQAKDGEPDFDVPETDLVNRLGNHVILRCSDADIVMAHMREGSVLVAEGDAVTVGQPVGEVGNSGASGEPHLHIHAQTPAAPGAAAISGEPLAVRIDGRFLVRGDRLSGLSR